MNFFFFSTSVKEIISKKKPFVPQRVEDIELGDVIKFSRPGGKISRGIVKYIGPLPDRYDSYLGLELDSEEGKHDGIYQSKRYFQSYVSFSFVWFINFFLIIFFFLVNQIKVYL